MRDLLEEFARFGLMVWRRFWQDDCLTMAGVLSYSTLLSLVPLTAVALAIIAAFPVFDQWTVALQEFVFRNFVPAAGEAVQEYLMAFVEKASQLTTAGTLFLIVTALWLIANVETTFNRIWRVHRARSLIGRFTTYWAALTVSPLLLGASLALTSYLTTLLLQQDPGDTLGVSHFVFVMTPFLASTLGITLLYLIVPNRRVNIRYAVAGGVLAALLFELAKRGFTTYIASVPTYQNIYGALAAIPIFLIWIFLSWLVILLGAEFAACLHSFRRRPPGTVPVPDFHAVYRVIGQLYRAQQNGEGLTVAQILDYEPGVNEEQIMLLLARLEPQRIVHRNETGRWMLSRDPGVLTLMDVYHTAQVPIPDTTVFGDDGWDQRLKTTMGQLDGSMEVTLGQPLSAFYGDDE